MSVDSKFSHIAWAKSLGGVTYPLLADFEPKGAVGKAYGLYLAEAGIDDRATVIVDKDGIVRYVASVTPDGKRDISQLAAECEKVDAEYGGGLSDLPDLG